MAGSIPIYYRNEHSVSGIKVVEKGAKNDMKMLIVNLRQLRKTSQSKLSPIGLFFII